MDQPGAAAGPGQVSRRTSGERDSRGPWNAADCADSHAGGHRLKLDLRSQAGFFAYWSGGYDDGLTDTTTGFDAATRKAYPDSTARKKIDDRFAWVFQGLTHQDNIYVKAE